MSRRRSQPESSQPSRAAQPLQLRAVLLPRPRHASGSLPSGYCSFTGSTRRLASVPASPARRSEQGTRQRVTTSAIALHPPCTSRRLPSPPCPAAKPPPAHLSSPPPPRRRGAACRCRPAGAAALTSRSPLPPHRGGKRRCRRPLPAGGGPQAAAPPWGGRGPGAGEREGLGQQSAAGRGGQEERSCRVITVSQYH